MALRYDEATMAAPQVVAMGADLVALKIREVAKAHEHSGAGVAHAGPRPVRPRRD